MNRIVVIGGGITGLAAAHRLVEIRKDRSLDFEILLVEASSRLGGVIQTEHREGFLIERGPDSFISEKPDVLDLITRIGLDSDLIETNPEHRRAFIVRNGRLRALPEGFNLLAPSSLWPFVTSDVISWPGKARMSLDLILPRGNTNGLEDESLARFVRRRLGQEALERLAQPMIGGIYTADPEKLSVQSTMPRLLQLEREHGSLIRAMIKEKRSTTRNSPSTTRKIQPVSGARYSLFRSFKGGMETLVEGIAAKLPKEILRQNTRVMALKHQPMKCWTIETDSGESISANGVCVALPSYACSRILRETDPNLVNELEAIPYASTATINLGFRRSDVQHLLDGFGFVVPFKEKRTLLACTFSSVKFGGRAPSGQVLLRAFVGGALQPDMFALSDPEMIERVKIDLHHLLGITAPPVLVEVARWERSMPQYHVGHLGRVNRIKNSVSAMPGLVLAGNAFDGPGIPDCVRSGEAAAEYLIRSLF